uniref:Envelope protein n=1 Tax=Porcine reproductive and respiratory syndrome virus TaxID=28344 RepID=D0UDL8_PRRSV|nr:envelope protein [Porcine reproductive and respiratory syndrome virus]
MLGKCFDPGCCSQLPSLWYIVPFCLAALVSANSNNSSHLQLIYNLTLCELNGTEWLAKNFVGAEKSFATFPGLPLIVSKGALTPGLFLDTFGLITVSPAGFCQGGYVLITIFAVGARAALVCFVFRLEKNCWAGRYSCPKYTNFLWDTKGKLYRWGSPVFKKKKGKVKGKGPLINLKKFGFEGSPAPLITEFSAKNGGLP